MEMVQGNKYDPLLSTTVLWSPVPEKENADRKKVTLKFLH